MSLKYDKYDLSYMSYIYSYDIYSYDFEKVNLLTEYRRMLSVLIKLPFLSLTARLAADLLDKKRPLSRCQWKNRPSFI